MVVVWVSALGGKKIAHRRMVDSQTPQTEIVAQNHDFSI